MQMEENSLWLRLFYETYRLQQLDLIQSGLCIMFSAFYNLHSHKSLFSEKNRHRTETKMPHWDIYCAPDLQM